MSDATLSTLDKIRIKVRRLTRSPSSSQLLDLTIDEYINTFVLYDFPEHLRAFYLRSTLTFYSRPYIDTYSTNTANPDDPLFNFKNLYTTTHGPVYIAGFNATLSQSREQFFGIYPKTNSIASIGLTGDGVTTNFVGTLTGVPFIRNEVTISSVDINNAALVLKDDGNGNLVIPNTTPTAPASTIDYITGAYVINFPVAPANGAAINSQTIIYVPSRPQAVLYYEGIFTLRPVPDQSYPINLEVYKRPDELLAANQMPELSEWWQYIAYGASKKIFEDRMDMESIQSIMPEFKKQEALINRRTIVQQSNDRVSTIYTEQTNLGAMGNGFFGGGL